MYLGLTDTPWSVTLGVMPSHKGIKPSREVLAEAHRTKSLVELGQEYGATPTTVWHWLKRYGILPHPVGKNLRLPATRSSGQYRDAAWLKKWYVDERKTIDEVAALCGVMPHTVWLWLHRLGITVRSISEAAVLAQNSGRYRAGVEHSKYLGGRFIDRKGYVQVLVAGEGRYRSEHRLVMEQHLGRSLTSKEIVHHINGDKQDNRVENLQLLSPTDHSPVLHVEAQLKAVLAENECLKQKLARYEQACDSQGNIT